MKNLLVLGGSALQLPAIQKAKSMGLCVAVADRDINVPGVSFADVFFQVSTIDEVGILRAAQEFVAHGVMTLATDMPMRAVAYTCERMGLPGISYETAIKATDKLAMIQAFEAHHVPHPWYLEVTSGTKENVLPPAFPCVCKPVDASGSRGVILVETVEQYAQAIIYSASKSNSGRVIVQEFLHGVEVSVEVLTLNGIPHILQITDKLTNGPPHFVEMGHSQPTLLDSDTRIKIENLACHAVCAIGLKNGPAHVEIIQTHEGPKLIELGARLGGDCIATHLIPLSTGIDIVEAVIHISLDETPDITQKVNKGAAIRYFDFNEGRIRSIENILQAQAIPGVHEIAFSKNLGYKAEKITCSQDRVGYIIAQAKDAYGARAVCEAALNTVSIIADSTVLAKEETP